MFKLGGIHIHCLQSQNNIEIFEMIAVEEGLGPGFHTHKNMEESFYLIQGKVIVKTENQEQLLKGGDFLKVMRNIAHSWKTAERNTKMLLIFSPSQNQLGYFTELEKLYSQNSSWEEAISLLSTNFDNTPVTISH